MNQCTKILRAARKASGYDKFHEWEAGMMDDNTFKPGYIGDEAQAEADIDLDEQWSGDLAPWADALKQAKVGDRIDFYVSSVSTSRDCGELVTNVGIKIVSEAEAIWCDCGGRPQTVKI